MQATLECTDGGWLLDNAPVSMSSLLAKSESKVYYCWGITDCIAQCLSSMPDSEVKALQRLLDSDSIVDLRIAAYLYCSANGRNEVLRLSDYGESILDAVWLTKHVPVKVLGSVLRGRVASEVSRQHGVPVTESSLREGIKAMTDTGQMVADIIHAKVPAIWETERGKHVLDRFGLPFIIDGVARHACCDAVYEATHLRYDLTVPIYVIGQKHPDVKLVQDILRFKRIKKDLNRMRRWLDDGVVKPEKVFIDNYWLTRSSTPCLDEPSFRRSVFAPNCLVAVNFNELALKIAQDQSKRLGKPLWPNAKSLSHLGATAMDGRGKHPTHVRIGAALLKGIVCNNPAVTVATEIWGYDRAYSKLSTLKMYMMRCGDLSDIDRYSDPWLSSNEESLQRSLGPDWQSSLPESVGLNPVDGVLAVVESGDDQLCGLPKAFIEAVWRMLEDRVTDLHHLAQVKKRQHGSSLLNHLLPQRGVNEYGLVLDGTNRAGAGLWSVYGSVHEVMRQYMWLLWSRHGYSIHGVSQLSVAVTPPDGANANIVLDQCNAALMDAQQLVCGRVLSALSMEASRRWR